MGRAEPHLVKLPEMAAILKCSRASVGRWVARRRITQGVYKLAGTRFLLFDPAVVLAQLEAGQKGRGKL